MNQPTTETTTPTAPTDTTTLTTDPKSADKDQSLLNKDDKSAEKPTAPDTYTAFKVPDGFELPEATFKEVTEVFKKHGLSQEAGQELVDFYAKQSQAAADAPFDFYRQMREGWRDEIAKDPKLGHRLTEVKTNLGRALDALGDTKLAADFRQAMDFTGAGDHPAFVRVIDAFVSKLTEGKPVHGSNPSPEGQRAPGSRPVDAAHALYPGLR